jgi:hypothetical protein
MDDLKLDNLEVEGFAEVLSDIARENSKNSKLCRLIEESHDSPVLVIDFHQNVPGEIVSIKDLDEVVKKESGVYKIMLFDSDTLKSHIPEISRKLSENLERLGEWTIVFTNAGKYCDLEEFRDFMGATDSIGRVILL